MPTYTASTASLPVSISAVIKATTMTLSLNPTTVVEEDESTVATITLKEGANPLASKTITVRAYSGGTQIGMKNYITDAFGAVTAYLTFWSVGTYTVRADYAGDATYGSSLSPVGTVTVTEWVVSTTTTLTIGSVAPYYEDTPYVFTATVKDQDLNTVPAGVPVGFAVDGVSKGSVNTDIRGQASITLQFSNPGLSPLAFTITATSSAFQTSEGTAVYLA